MENKEDLKVKLLESMPTMLRIFNNEPALLHMTGSTMIVGDIHGSLDSLMLMVEEWEETGYDNLLFLGDYVDRGTQGLECLSVLFNFKKRHPDNIFLLRGNHEDINMNMFYGFLEETGNDETFLMKLNEVYESLPVAAILGNSIFCVHGGITEDTELGNISKNNSLEYLWNDPSNEAGITDSRRGEGVKMFGEDIVDKFLAVNGLNGILRSHEYCEKGYQCWFSGKLLTIFSCDNYCQMGNPASFIAYENKKVSLYVFDS